MSLEKGEDKGLEGKQMEFRFYSVLMGSHCKRTSAKKGHDMILKNTGYGVENVFEVGKLF